MYALLLAILQPAPDVSTTPEPVAVVRVDLIIVNQYCSLQDDENGRPINRVQFYTSFWRVHRLPMCPIPVFEHRGWSVTKPVHRCDGGYATEHGGRLVVAPQVIVIVSDYDFEYRNRDWYRPIARGLGNTL